MSSTPPKRHVWAIALMLYLLIGFALSVARLFLHTSDLPDWGAYVGMVRALPSSLPDLLLAIVFWILMPAITWPLVLSFYLIMIVR